MAQDIVYFFLLVCIFTLILPYSKFTVWWIRDLELARIQLFFISIALIFLTILIHNNIDWLNSLFVILLAICAVSHLKEIHPYTLLGKKEVNDAIAVKNKVKVFIANVLMRNTNYYKCLALIEDCDPDYILLVEANKNWEEALQVLKTTHPYHVLCPNENEFGMLFYSKYPVIESNVRYLVSDEVPSLYLVLEDSLANPIHFFAVHPKPPAPDLLDNTSNSSVKRDRELSQIASEVKNLGAASVIVSGDLNDVAWSETTKKFQKISKLLDLRKGRGFLNTFHAKIPFLRFPLDHIFVSPHFQHIDFKRLDNIGSDHFPVVATLEHKQKSSI